MEDLSREPVRFFHGAGLDATNIDARTLVNTWAILASDRWHLHSNAPFLWFRRKLWAWGEQWKLNEDWCLKAAFDTLLDWAHDPEHASELSWSLMIHASGYVVRPIPGEDRFTFEHQGWQLTIYRTRKEYEDFIRAAFETALKSYCDQIEQAAPLHGYVEVPPLKHSRKPELPFEWLVRYRVQEWSINKISNHYYPNSENRRHIREGINEAASLVGFPLYEFTNG
ncbi:MAG TPA: hypothetical protein VGB98_02360 [Pyrinomonadaceae bacterium]